MQHSEHLQRGPRKSGDDWVLWAPAAFAWQVQHLEHLSLILRGGCSTRSISSVILRGSPAARSEHHPELARFCSGSVRLNTMERPRLHFAWQVKHSEHLQRGPRKSGDDWVPWLLLFQVKHLEHLSLILHGRCSTRSTFREVLGSLATVEYYGRRLLLRGKCSTWTSVSFCVAGHGAALGASQCHFAWQVQHSEHLQGGPRKSGDDWVLWALAAFAWQVQHLEDLSFWVPWALAAFAWQVQHLEDLSFILRGRCSTWSTSREVRESPATIEYHGCFFQVKHLKHLSLILRGRCSTRSAFREVLGSLATVEYYGRRLLLRGKCSTWTSVSYCVAGHGVALGASQCHFAWQVQHSEHLQGGPRGLRKSGQVSMDFAATETNAQLGSTKRKEHHAAKPRPSGQHSYALVLAQPSYPSAHLHITIYPTPSTQHHLHYIVSTCQHYTICTPSTHTICTTSSSTQPHQHITIYITPSTQHHLHNIIHTTPSTLYHHILAGAALGALPCYPFCLIPADTPLVILRCGFFFVLFLWPIPHLDVRRHC